MSINFGANRCSGFTSERFTFVRIPLVRLRSCLHLMTSFFSVLSLSPFHQTTCLLLCCGMPSMLSKPKQNKTRNKIITFQQRQQRKGKSVGRKSSAGRGSKRPTGRRGWCQTHQQRRRLLQESLVNKKEEISLSVIWLSAFVIRCCIYCHATF